ncbi:MAG: hypothetical protein ACK5Q5_14985 [Planctomycetaceae bacterium]
MPKDTHRDERRIISHTTVLILSAFVIGMAAGNTLGTELEPYVLACGLTGIVSFIGLEVAAFRRKIKAIEQEQRHVEGRLDRHVLSQSNAGFCLLQTEEPAIHLKKEAVDESAEMATSVV